MSQKERPTGTVTFVFTDIVGSTRLLEAVGPGYPDLLERHQLLLREAFAEHGGIEFGAEGDSLAYAFSKAQDALAGAIAGQRAILSADWRGIDLRIRIGIHTGDALARNEKYLGIAVHQAHRIMSVANGSQILVSSSTEELVKSMLPPDTSLMHLGLHRLKDLSGPHELFQVKHPNLPSEFPPLQSVDAMPNNLPLQLTTFVGRSLEVQQIHKMLESHRMVTILGPGGVGKTRVALQSAAEVPGEFPDGVWFVDLGLIDDETLVITAIAEDAQVKDLVASSTETEGEALLKALTERLRASKALLILDNCEHVVNAVAPAAFSLLTSCPQLTLLATSRELLGVPGEQVFRLAPLDAPDPSMLQNIDDLLAYDSVQLFIERARLQKPEYQPAESDAAALAEISFRLDGIPLAIELAASRLRSMSTDQIASRLGPKLDLLATSSRTLPSRRQTLRATIDWSYELLGGKEQTLLASLAVFRGGFTLEAAEAVCSVAGVDESEILDLLASLVDKSLIAEYSGRYRLLETIRQYAWEKLLEPRAMSDVTSTLAADGASRGTLRKEGEFWEISLGKSAARLKDSKGLRYLQILLGSPDREIHVLDLASQPGGRQDASHSEAGLSLGNTDAGEVIDVTARRAYRQRIIDLQEDLDEAISFRDPEREQMLREELEAIASQLASAEGMGGRARRVGSSAERARVSVTKAVKSTVQKIEEHLPELGDHLKRTIHTGVFCSYRPDPLARIEWDLN